MCNGACGCKLSRLTFIAEWGDRSQIATVALAGDYEAYGIVSGCFRSRHRHGDGLHRGEIHRE